MTAPTIDATLSTAPDQIDLTIGATGDEINVTVAESSTALALIAAEVARAQAAEAAINVGLRFAVANAVATTNVASRSGTTTIDGVSLGVNATVLLVGQSTGSQNGLWTVKSGAWTRPSNFAAGNDATGMSVYVEAGSSENVGTWAVVGVGPYLIDTNATSWILLSGLGDIVLGTALSKTGTTLNVVLGTSGTSAAAGNDSRITGAAQKANNLSDLANASTARSNLGLGSLATVTPTGTPDGTKFLRDDNVWAAAGGGGSLTSDAGALGADANSGTSGTFADILSTASLATGTWLITFDFDAVPAGPGSGLVATFKVVTGTATATVDSNGKTITTTPSTTEQVGGSVTVRAVITSAGTIKLQATTTGGTAATVKRYASSGSTLPATRWTAVKIA